jgi:hypothetical protein
MYYYVFDYEIDNASTLVAQRLTFIQDSHANSPVNITAHEMGHSLNLSDLYNDNIRLMYGYSDSGNPSELIKNEWDAANSTANSF